MQIIASAGMPNLRKDPFSTDFDRLFQSTEKKRFLDESTEFFVLSSATTLLPPPPRLLDSLYFACAE